MKKIFLMAVLILSSIVSIQAQIIRIDELENYSKEKYGENWIDAATNIGSQITLDQNNAINYIQVIQAEGKTQDQLYVLLNYWFTSTFNDGKSVIQLNDKELGTIIAKGYLESIAAQAIFMGANIIDVAPIIKCDIKDEKVRVTYTIPYFIMYRQMARARDSPKENYTLDRCYPFAKKSSSHKRTFCKALVMVHAYSNVIIDKIEECLKNGLVGNENDNW